MVPFALAFSLAACDAPPGSKTHGSSVVQPSEAHHLVETGATLVDVRTPEEFQARHIPGALNVPVDELEDHLAQVPSGKPVVVYCATGMRSAAAARILRGKGRTDVFDLGPMSRW